MMTNKRNVSIGLVLLALSAGIFYATFAKKRSESGAKVRAVVAERRDITSRVLAQGTLRAKRQVEVASEITGRVKTIFVTEGEQVEKGAPLYEIDDVEYRNAVKQLQVGLKAAKANRARANLMRQEAERQRVQNQKLKDKGLLSGDLYTASVSRVALADADVRATRAQIEQAQLELARAGDALLKAKVKAPLSGTVVSVPIEVGQVLTAGLSSTGGGFMAPSISQAVVVADLSELVAKLTVDELDIGNVEKDKSCTDKIVEGPFRALRALDDGDPVDIEEEVPLPGDEKASDKKAGKKNENND